MTASANAVYTEAAIAVQNSLRALWTALATAGAVVPEEDRDRSLLHGALSMYSTPEIRTAKRSYDRALAACLEGNIGLVHRIVNRLVAKAERRGLEKQDLIQEGLLGLQRALVTFDPSRDLQFSTYAFYWIFQNVNRCVQNAGIIRVPIHTQELEARGKKPGLLGERARIAKYIASLDAPVKCTQSGEYLDKTYYDLLVCGRPSAEESAEESENRALLNRVSHSLTTRERSVIRGRVVLDQTLEEIGRELSLTRERVRQIEMQALGKLRLSAKNQKISFNALDSRAGPR